MIASVIQYHKKNTADNIYLGNLLLQLISIINTNNNVDIRLVSTAVFINMHSIKKLKLIRNIHSRLKNGGVFYGTNSPCKTPPQSTLTKSEKPCQIYLSFNELSHFTCIQ